MPYISASIIMQLMTYVIPTLEALKKEGYSKSSAAAISNAKAKRGKRGC